MAMTMNYLLENAAPIWIAGAILLTMAGIVYSSLRTGAAMLGMIGVILLTAAGLLGEYLYQTPREKVQAAMSDLFAAIEADDVPGVLARLAPGAAEIRADAQNLMPRFDIIKTRASSSINVTFPGDDSQAQQATVDVTVFVQVTHKTSGMRGGNMARVEFQLQRQGDQWLVTEYSVSEDWRRGAESLGKSQ